MFARGGRRLQVETLESRRVLNGDPLGVCLAPEPAAIAPPPPAGQDAVDAVVVTSFSTNHVRVRDTKGGVFMQIDGRRNPENGFAEAFMTGDFNGDGGTDLLGADNVGDWWLYLNDGQRLHERSVGPGLIDVEHLGTAHMNQDDRLDIVSYNDTTGDLWVSINTPTGFEHQNWGEFRNPNGWTSLHIGDFSGDGLVDVLAGEVGGHWWLAQNNNGTDFNNYRWGRYADFNWTDTLEGEFTGDQYSDIVARAPDNTWWLWEGSDSGFANAQFFGHWKMRDGWKDVATGDFNGDQIDDIVGRSSDGWLWVGSATEQGFQSWAWATGWIDGADWSQVTIMDINGDGMDDQVGHAADNTWWYALSKGGRFQNEFWQKGGEGDFVTQGFKPKSVLDVSASFIDVDETPEPVRPRPKPTESIENGYLNVVDGRLVLNGTFAQLAGVEVLSNGGYLSLETVEIPPLGDVPLANPFGPAEGIIVENTPNSVVVGVLGADRRIDIDGTTITSILYSGPVEEAANDLTVNLGLDDSPPMNLRVGEPSDDEGESGTSENPPATEGPETSTPVVNPNPNPEPGNVTGTETDSNGEQYVRVNDGRLVLNGSFTQLAGIQVISQGGFLSLESTNIPGVGQIKFKAPFSASDGTIVQDSATQVVIGVLGRNKRIDIEGETVTSILYSGAAATATSDLTVAVGLGDSPALEIHVGV